MTYRVIFTSPLGTHAVTVTQARNEEVAEGAALLHLRKQNPGLPYLFKSIEAK